MDHEFSNHNNKNSNCGILDADFKTIDASAILLNTLHAFEDINRLENIAVNDEITVENMESFLPTLENIMALSSYLRDSIEFLLNIHGLTNDPEFVIALNKKGTGLKLSGGRKDLRKVNKLLNNDPEIKEGLITLLSIADQTYSILTDEDVYGEQIVYLYGDGYLSLYKES